MPEQRSSSLRRGAAFMAGSSLLFAGMSLAVKLAARSLPNTVVVFFRCAVGLALLLPWLLRQGPRGLRTTRPFEHAVRGLGGLLAMTCGFYAMGHMRLAEAVLLTYSLPLLLPLVERAWLGQRIARRLWLPLAVGFVGLLIILRPGTSVFGAPALAALGSAFFASIAQVGIRSMAQSEPTARIVFYFALISTAGAALPLPFTWVRPGASAWPPLLAAGVLATAGQFTLTRAYACAPASSVGPFIYLTPVLSGLLDWAFWGTLPDALFLAGALLVVAAAVLALRLREKDASPVPMEEVAR